MHFGNKNEMPKCSYLDCLKSGYLCENFIAIFEKYPKWRFNTLSTTLYRNSPFLNLDEGVIPITEQLPEVNENKSEGELEGREILCNDDQTIFESLPRKKKH